METRMKDVPSTQVSLSQKEKMEKNGKWDYQNLFATMEVVGTRFNIQIRSQMFNIHIASLHNHLYGLTQS